MTNEELNKTLQLIKQFVNKQQYENANDADKEQYKAGVEELCAQNNAEGLLARGMGAYLGERAWPQSWNDAEEYLKRAYDANENPEAANFLGNIYYYGYLGEPDFDLARYYYTVGAVGGIDQSHYMLADILYKGDGCHKAPMAAERILNKLYGPLLNAFCAGHHDCRIADVALRMSNLCLTRAKGKINVQGAPSEAEAKKAGEQFLRGQAENAFRFGLQAKIAIDLRIKALNNSEDEEISKEIEKQVQAAADFFKPGEGNTLSATNLNDLINSMSLMPFVGGTLPGSIERRETGEYVLTLGPLIGANNEKPLLFVTAPCVGFCGLFQTVQISIRGAEAITVLGENIPEGKRGVKFNGVNANALLLNNSPVAEISGQPTYVTILQ